MAKLQISTAQRDTYVSPVDTHLENAFLEGVEVPGPAPVLDPIQNYGALNSLQRSITRSTFRLVIAAIIKALGLPGLTATMENGSFTFTNGILTAGTSNPGLTVTINYRKSDGISNGTLTFTNGILTAQT